MTRPAPRGSGGSSRANPVTGWIATAAVAIALFAVPLPAEIVERVYSRGLFPRWQGPMTAVSNLVPFAVLDVLIGLVALLVSWRGWRLAAGVRRRGWLPAAWEGVRRCVRAASILAIAFVLVWGLNYRRVPLERTLPPAMPTIGELRAVLREAGALGARLRPADAGRPPAPGEIRQALRGPFGSALRRLGRPPLTTAGRPKHSFGTRAVLHCRRGGRDDRPVRARNDCR